MRSLEYSDVEPAEDTTFDDDNDPTTIADSNSRRASRRGINTLRSYCPTWWLQLIAIIAIVTLWVTRITTAKDSTKDNTNKMTSSSPPRDSNPSSSSSGGNQQNKESHIKAFSSEFELLLCDPNIQCMTDRWSYSNLKLFVGQSMCNDEWRFGVIRKYSDFTTSLVWQDCNTKETIYLQNVTLSANIDEPSVAFQITENGTFELLEVRIKNGIEEPVSDEIASNNPLWTYDSAFVDDITPTSQCLNKHPIMDCPYLHLRKHGGNIVLNYESKQSGWIAKGISKSYPNLFPDTFNP